MRAPVLLAGAGLALLLGGCAGTSRDPQVVDSFCATRVERSMRPIPQLRDGQEARLLAGGFSAETIDMAESVGALDALEGLIAAERRGDTGRLALAEQVVTQRIVLGILDVQTSLAAIDCEEERGTRLRGQLQARELRRADRLNWMGLMIGAATAAATGGLALSGADMAANILGIVGGGGEATAGGLGLISDTATGSLRSGIGLLNDIRRQPARSEQFPPSVWRYLTRRDPPGSPNVADQVVTEWHRAGLPADGDPDAEKIFAYEARLTTSDTELRDAMLHQLQARVTLMSSDLRLMQDELLARPTLRLQAMGRSTP